jgi:large subunit ribosomal protein L4
MALTDVRDLNGKTVGQVELADSVFAVKVNPHLLHEAVRWHLARKRAGTHKTKGRGDVAGSGRKLWRQKGTGRARVGSIRSSLWRKGGTVHGPQPRSYAYLLPRRMILGALRSALSAKFAEQKLTVVNEWNLESHKSKDLQRALTRLDGAEHTVLVVQEPGNHNLELASRNLEGVRMVPPSALEVYDLLRHDRVMLSKDTAVGLGRSLGPKNGQDATSAEPITPAGKRPETGTKQTGAAGMTKAEKPAKSARKATAKPRATGTKGHR